MCSPCNTEGMLLLHRRHFDLVQTFTSEHKRQYHSLRPWCHVSHYIEDTNFKWSSNVKMRADTSGWALHFPGCYEIFGGSNTFVVHVPASDDARNELNHFCLKGLRTRHSSLLPLQIDSNTVAQSTACTWDDMDWVPLLKSSPTVTTPVRDGSPVLQTLK